VTAVKSQRSALIIASDDYTDPGLKRLRAPASDARALAAVLRDPGIGDFEVRTLLNEPAHEVNLAVEEFFADRQADDLLLVHFSCHGVKDEDGELYFATADTRLRRLGATAVAAEFVNRRMNRSRSRRVVLLLDCCYAGAFEHGMTARAGEGVGIGAQFGGRGRAVITASSAMEYAFEGDQLTDTRALAPSVFTSALVEGLETGDADRDQDGLVALDELYDYVYDRVRTVTPNQTPGKWTFGVQGELVIARRSRPVTTPAPLPPELQEAIDSPLASVRAAAVHELARALHGTHAGRALAARLALERLTNDDSRTAAAAAAEVLGAAAGGVIGAAAVGEVTGSVKEAPAPPRLELSATAVDFGRIGHGTKSPERRIRLRNAGGGSLNARAAIEVNWLRLRLDGDELVLTVDTVQVGRHEHILAVDSDGGSGSLLVQAFVEPAEQPAPEPASTPPEPSPPRRPVPAAPQRTGLSSPSPAPPVSAPEPAPPSAPTMPGGGAGPGGRPARRRAWIAIAAAGAVVAAGVVSYLLLAGGHKTPSPAPPPQVLPPPCTQQTAKASVLPGVPSNTVTIGRRPFDAVVAGRIGFVTTSTGLAVMDTTNFVPRFIRTVPLPTANGEALTPDQQHLLVAGNGGVNVFSVSDLKQGLPAWLGELKSPNGSDAIEVVPSPNGRFAFATLKHSGQVAVFNLHQALTRGFGLSSNLVRTISVGATPIGIAVSTDRRYLYVAQQGLGDSVGASGQGSLVVLDMARAEKKSAAHPIVHTVDAGCGPARVLPAADGKHVWVTVGASNALLAYSAAKLISDPGHALIARVALGQTPLGMAMVNNGQRMVIADSNRGGVAGSVSSLAVVDVAKALAREPALIGLIRSGTTPREFALEPNGITLLVTNTDSHQVQAVDVSHLP
jgi:DNA-binding beta-propeller fold protein YncE